MVIYYDFVIFESRFIRGKRKWSRFFYFYYKNFQAARATFKVAISDYTKKRALELFPKAREQSIRVLHPGARSIMAGLARTAKFPVLRLRFLYVGAYEPRKNIDALLRNFDLVTGGMPADLHLVGQLGPGRKSELVQEAAGVKSPLHIHWHGLVSDGELRCLYEESHFLVFPSLFEGFGLPVVESMGAGLVVCAFRNSCLPEVGGDAVVLRDDNDFAGWGAAIAEMAANPKIYWDMSRRAQLRAAYFSEMEMGARYAAYFMEIFSLTIGSS